MINKQVADMAAALDGIGDGATVMIGGVAVALLALLVACVAAVVLRRRRARPV